MPAARSVSPFMAVVSDMDGTLLRDDHSISARTAKVIAYLEHQRNVPFIFATGRHHCDVLETKRELGVDGYVITSNGARAHDPKNTVVLKRDFPPETARSLALLVAMDPDIATSIYQEDHWYMNKHAIDFTGSYQDHKDIFFYELFDPSTHATYAGTYKVYYTVDNHDHIPKLDALYHRIRDEYGDAATATFTLPYALEITAKNVDKGATLALLLKQHVFPDDPRDGDALARQCVVFGDGQNDYEMLVKGGMACVMANAQDRLLDHLEKDGTAFVRIGHNMEDAVAEKLIELFQISEADIA